MGDRWWRGRGADATNAGLSRPYSGQPGLAAMRGTLRAGAVWVRVAGGTGDVPNPTPDEHVSDRPLRIVCDPAPTRD